MAAHHSLRIGLAQIDTTLGDVSANLLKVANVAAQHRAAADLLVFPELTLTGYALGGRCHEYALRRDDPRLLALASDTRGMTLAVGFIEETPAFSLYNSVAFLADGAIQHVHRKINLPNYGIFEEKKHFTAGETLAATNIGPFRTASLICADAWNPALAHIAAHEDALLLTMSVCSPEGGLGAKFSSQDGWKRLSRFYASMYGCYVAFVNRVGREGELTYWGESELIDPFGRQVAACKGRHEEVVVATIGIDQVREARINLPTIRDDNPALLVRHLDRAMTRKHRE